MDDRSHAPPSVTPPTRPRLDQTRLPLAIVQQLAALRCAVDALSLLARAQGTSDSPFSPDAIRYWHTSDGWAMLAGAEIGGAMRYDRIRGSRYSALDLALIKAQLEVALDVAASDRLHWRSVRFLYGQQRRYPDYLARYVAAGRPRCGATEPDRPLGTWELYWRMAAFCGWREGEEERAA